MRQLINNTFDRGNFGNNRQIRTLVGRVVADGWACARTVFSWPVSSVSRYPATLKSRWEKRAAMAMQAAGLMCPQLALVAVGHATPVISRRAHRLMRQS